MHPGSSRSEPRASTSIAFRKRSRASGFTRTFTHIASIALSISVGSPRARILREPRRCRHPRKPSLRLAQLEMRSAAFGSVRPRHAEHVLAEIGEHHIGRDRGGLVEAGFAP